MDGNGKIVTTLCIVNRHPKILLGMKKRGFGAGRWNGFGGKVAENEHIDEAAIRELKEETGITARDVEKRGVIDFTFKDDPLAIEMHIFAVNAFDGEPTETEEMAPKWFHVSDIPFTEMWPDDKYWLPLFLEGKSFQARFSFDGYDKIIDWSLSPV